MNSSPFMDKQIMGLTATGSQTVAGGGGVEFFDLMNPKEDLHQNGGKKEEILPSYDFQPIRTASSPPPVDAARRSWSSGDSKIGSSSVKYGGILEPCEVANATREKEKAAYDKATIAEIDRTVKKHADNLLHVLEGVSSGLLQMESRTRHLENSMDELKVSIEKNAGSSDRKLKHLENILREMQSSVQVLREKQEITEAQLQLAKLQISKGDPQQPETSNTGQFDLKQQLPPPPPPSQPQPIQQAVQLPVVASPQVPPLPAAPPVPNAPPPLLHENPSSSQFPPQLSQSQFLSMPSLPRGSYFPPPGQPSDTTHQPYQMTPQQPQAPQPPPPTQHYQSSLQLPQYSQPPPQPQSVHPSPQLQTTLPHQPEESAPYPSYSYPPSIRQPPPLTHPPSGPLPEQFYGSNPNMYEPPSSIPSTGQRSFSGGYGPQAGSNYSDPYPYSGSPSHYSSSKPSPFSSPGPAVGGISNYPRLPTAQILPQAPPTGTSAGGSSGNKVPIDDVVDKVATMGFSREQVRAAVRKLTESGQAVDLNTVLDKLMNDGELQPQRGWFGR